MRLDVFEACPCLELGQSVSAILVMFSYGWCQLPVAVHPWPSVALKVRKQRELVAIDVAHSERH